METYVGKDEYYNHIANRIGMQMPSVKDTIKREDFDSDEAFVDAIARKELEMEENPRLVELKRKHYVELARQREEEQREKERKQREAARAAAKLTEKEKREVAAAALDAATADLRSGRITHEQFDEAKEKYREKIENNCLDRKATGTVFNEWFHQEVNRNRYVMGTPQPDGK